MALILMCLLLLVMVGVLFRTVRRFRAERARPDNAQGSRSMLSAKEELGFAVVAVLFLLFVTAIVAKERYFISALGVADPADGRWTPTVIVQLQPGSGHVLAQGVCLRRHGHMVQVPAGPISVTQEDHGHPFMLGVEVADMQAFVSAFGLVRLHGDADGSVYAIMYRIRYAANGVLAEFLHRHRGDLEERFYNPYSDAQRGALARLLHEELDAQLAAEGLQLAGPIGLLPSPSSSSP